MLVLSENALYNTKIKKPFWFWQHEPEVFDVKKFSIKLPDSMIIQDNSSEISKTLRCMQMQYNTPYHITSFAKNYLYTILYCNGNMGNINIDIFDTFFSVKTNGPQVDSVSFQDEKAVYLDAQKKVHSVKVDLSYIGTRNSTESKSIGFGEMIVKEGGQFYKFAFYPVIDDVEEDLNGFVASLREGASDVIKDQAKDIVFGQAISDLADISAPDMYNLEIGSVICEAHSLYEFLNELQSFTKKWNKMKNGLVLEPNTNVRIQAVEEHTELANEVTVAEDTGQSGESVDNIEKKDAFIDIINTLSSQYGSLRIVQNNGEWQNEANGLCYLNLIDFTGDGKEELMAVCKNEDEEHYTGYIYTIKDGSVELLYENPIIEYNFFQGFDVVNLGYTADTGYVFGTGWEDADADDMTFFWYKDGKFEPVYRYNGYWDGDLDDEVIYEESIIVDIFDDDHRDEYYNNSPSVTLRTMSDINVDGDAFSLDDLQRNIDIVIQKLEGDSNTSNVDRTDTPSINEDINYDEFTMEEFGIPYGHYYGGKPQGEGVFGLDINLYEDLTFSIQSSFDLFSDEDGDEYSYTGTYKINRVDDDGNPVLLLHCDEGDYEFVWNGEQLLHDPIFAWYEGESSTREDENSDNSSDEDYQDVINEYKTAYNDFEQYREDPSAFMEKYPLVNANALIEPYLSSIDLTFFSAIKDINEDGVDELIMGVGTEHPNSIYTRYNDQIISLINDIGERSYINIYDDGTIYRHDSGGASFSIDTIYEINESGDGLNTIKQYEADWERNLDYPYSDGTENLSQEQFIAEYLDKNEMEFDWSK